MPVEKFPIGAFIDAAKFQIKTPGRKGFDEYRSATKPQAVKGDRVSYVSDQEYFLQNEYLPRLKEGFRIHEGKLYQIYAAAMSSKQVMSQDVIDLLESSALPGGNAQDKMENASKYVHPIGRAIELKIIAEMTAAPVDLEFDTLSDDPKMGVAVDVINDIVASHFARKRNVQQLQLAVNLFVNRGTLIAEPQFKKSIDKRTWKNSKGEEVPVLGQMPGYLTFAVYDPLMTIIDPAATPGRVADTAGWAIVTLGRFSAERIRDEFNVEISIDKARDSINIYSFPGGEYWVPLGQSPEMYSRSLDSASGEQGYNGYVVRKYLRASDGAEYVIIDDGYVVSKKQNDLGVSGRLWLCWAPYLIDLESPYGTPVQNEIKPSVDVISTLFNMVCDRNKINLQMPTFAFEGMVDMVDLTSNDHNPTDIVSVKATQYMDAPGFQFDINRLFGRPKIEALTPETSFAFSEALNAIWFLTGLSPQALSGTSESQIRVSSAVDLINGASLRNNSMAVQFYESCFLNVLAQEYHFILIQHYDEFPALASNGITREMLSMFDDVRVRNGSYLPQDKVPAAQRASVLYQMSKESQVIDPVRAARNFAKKTIGVNLKQYERDPLELLTQEQAIALVSLAQQGKLNQLVAELKKGIDQNANA